MTHIIISIGAVTVLTLTGMLSIAVVIAVLEEDA